MAASPTPRPTPKTSAEALAPTADPAAQALAAWSHRHCVSEEGLIGVAFSGGADSTALLHAALARWPGRVVALHVHHGLQAAADGFESHVRGTCDRLALPLRVARVDARHRPGQSPEDAARLSRYAALATMAADLTVVLLGQHLDDQAETVLLALSRGAGLPGLAAMPEVFDRHGVRFGRPLLPVPAEALRKMLRDQARVWIEDPTNDDLRYTRNRLRQRLLPLWCELFPHGAQALARTAAHAAQAQHLLDDLARIDLEAVGQPPALRALQGLGRERQANALRHWLRQAHGVLPSAAQLDELLDQVQACRTRGHRLHLKVGPGAITRDGERLRYTPPV